MLGLEEHKKHYLTNYYGQSRLINWQHFFHIKRSIEVAGLSAGDLVLDVGCADCELAVRIQDKCRKVIGVDRNYKHVMVGRQRLRAAGAKNFQLIVEHVKTFLNFPDNYFDKIFCLETFEHSADQKQMLAEMHRILKDDASLIITVPMESGMPLLAKYIIASLSKQFSYRAKYTPKELFKAVIFHQVEESFWPQNAHKCFNWKAFKRMVEEKFKIEVFEGIPIRALGTFLNTGILIKCRK